MAGRVVCGLDGRGGERLRTTPTDWVVFNNRAAKMVGSLGIRAVGAVGSALA